MFYVHISDPGFPEPPWPNARRLGPYLTLDEAHAQAANDLALGHLADHEFLGIHDEAGSTQREIRDDNPLAVDLTDQKLLNRLIKAQRDELALARQKRLEDLAAEHAPESIIGALVAAGALKLDAEATAALKKAGVL